MDVLTDKPHRRSLLDHFSAVPDPRQAWRVAHPLPEVLLLVVCGTIASNDDYDDIVDWGGAPSRVPAPLQRVPLRASHGKTSRRSYDRKAGSKALHLVSAFATNERLVLGQKACAEKSNETTAIPALLARLAACGNLTEALVSIDAIACNPDIAQARAEEVEAVVEANKDHGRIETRRCVVSRQIDWL